MSALTKKKFYTPEEYLEFEDNSDSKNEYDDGVIIPIRDGESFDSPEMSGTTEAHNTIVLNIAFIFRSRLRDKCRTYANDLKVWVEKKRKFYYPDVFVVCDKLKFYEERNTVVENPTIIVEVLSKSTGLKDRTEKLWAYQSIDSVQHYLLVSQDKTLVESFSREGESWKYLATIGIESKVNLESLNVDLELRDIYDLVEFEIEEFEESDEL